MTNSLRLPTEGGQLVTYTLREPVVFAKPSKPAFIALMALDALVVLIILVTWGSFGLADSEVNMLAGLTAGAFAAKGLLTGALRRELPAKQADSSSHGKSN